MDWYLRSRTNVRWTLTRFVHGLHARWKSGLGRAQVRDWLRNLHKGYQTSCARSYLHSSGHSWDTYRVDQWCICKTWQPALAFLQSNGWQRCRGAQGYWCRCCHGRRPTKRPPSLSWRPLGAHHGESHARRIAFAHWPWCGLWRAW